MPIETIHNFSIQRLSILDVNGRADPSLTPKLDIANLRRLFEDMLLLRAFDERAVRMQRQGRLGTYAPATGQEAVHIGSAVALASSDWVVPSFREQGVYLSRGIKPLTMFLFFMGSEEGNRLPKELNTLPYCVPCASQLLHAVGIGLAAKINQDPIATITYLGDGATSEGDYHEAMNFAAVTKAPVIFLCQNNHWAISTPPDKQYRCESLAQRAIAYGMPGIQVDGNDILAVYHATKTAQKRAHRGDGPSFIECETYRMGCHTTSDDPTRYRSEDECLPWIAKDPIDRFEKYLLAQKVIQPGERELLIKTIDASLKIQAEQATNICERLNPEAMFTYLYKNMPPQLRKQIEAVLQQSLLDSEETLHA